MEKFFRSLLLVMAIMFGLNMEAQTIHAIVFCNTIDGSIGKSMAIDLTNVSDKIGTLGKLLSDNYDFELIQLEGKDCTRAKLKSVIDKMDVESNDVMFVFYGGHGSHAENNESDPWPQYCMNTGFENQANWLPMMTLAKWINEKNARLSIIVSNCCNKEQAPTTIKPLWADDGRATKLDGFNAENYKKLFSVQGSVLATSSKLGQYSWCNENNGGFFTCDFIDVLDMVGKGAVAPDWNKVLKEAYDRCSARQIRTQNGFAAQNPYYKVNVSGPGTHVPPPPGDNPPINKPRTESLADALANIMNKNVNQDARIDLIYTIASKYFDSGAKVITVGNDMKTQFEYEDVTDFLRRICLSPYIKGVNIISESRSLLKVHELR